jgi:hypothetical protein
MKDAHLSEYLRIKSLVTEIPQEKGWLSARCEWARYQYKGKEKRYPFLYLDDLSAIPQLDDIAGIEFYQQRARLRTDSGDFVALTHPLEKSYEDYNQAYLGLGSPTIVQVENSGYHPIFIARNLAHNKTRLIEIAEACRDQEGIVIHPYMGSRDVWNLAQRLDQVITGKVRVLAPPPHLTDFVNNKVIFTELVKSILGDDSVIETRVANCEDEVLLHLRQMSQEYPRVAIKMGNYASAMGNQIFESADLRHLSPVEFDSLIKTKLWALNWNGFSSLCVVRWYDNVLSSPSAHLWIPPLEQGPPIVEGIFDQLLEGETKIFSGSKTALLPDKLRSDITQKTFRLGVFLQELGYVGRCSFDTIIHGPSFSAAKPKFVECNGRWGGTSLPMSLYKRIFGDTSSIGFLARDYMDSRLIGHGFNDLMKAFHGILFNNNSGTGHYILYNVGCLHNFGKFDVMVLGDSEDELKYRAFQEVPSLINKIM